MNTSTSHIHMSENTESVIDVILLNTTVNMKWCMPIPQVCNSTFYIVCRLWQGSYYHALCINITYARTWSSHLAGSYLNLRLGGPWIQCYLIMGGFRYSECDSTKYLCALLWTSADNSIWKSAISSKMFDNIICKKN